METYKTLEKITFSIASTEEIRNKSVYIANISKYNDNKENSVYDHRSGSIFNKKCSTCKMWESECTGHFGHIELNAVIVHPIFFNHAFDILRIICHSCSRLLITKTHLEFSGIIKFENQKKITEIINKVKKINKCFHCGTVKRDYVIKKDPYYNIIQVDNEEITDTEIKKIFDDIDQETLKLLDISHPKNCCLEVFPVIPPCCRPYEFVGTTIKEDDLTKQLVEIIKVNNLIASAQSTKDKYDLTFSLKNKIESYCRNPKKKIKSITNNEPVKCIRERLTGKDGQLRDNLMGKRTEMSSRTVIGPGPDLKVDEVGIPEIISNSITFPINVYQNNINEVKKLIYDGSVEKLKRNDKIIRVDLQIYSEIIKILEIDDVVIRNNKNIIVKDTKFKLFEGDRIIRNMVDITPETIPLLCEPDVNIGDIAQRKIVNGDIVLMNRQPTLWKGSMMAFKCKITKNKTFTFNPSTCKAFNSDFDGDEKNAHFPQSKEASIELLLLSTPSECLLSSSNGNPIIVILQDALIGSYLMTLDNSFIVSKSEYNDIVMCLSKNTDIYLNRKIQIEQELKKNNLYKGPHSMRTGKAIMSLILPENFNLKTEDIIIKNGTIIEGFLSKKYLGSTKTSIIYLLKMEYGNQICVDFINDIQFMTNKWLTFHSFSINIFDCKQNDFSEDIIKEKLIEADMIDDIITNRKLAEIKINMILSNAKDIGMKISDDLNNNIIHAIKSGSKGDYFNLGQVKGLLGQQIINGGRIENMLDNNSRTLIHYNKHSLTQKEKYESKGFIMNSFYKGLNPQEFFFHSMSGRQGVCDTAMTTYMSGYNMRKLIKLCEDIKIQNNGTVSDSHGNIYSYSFGNEGLNPELKNTKIHRILDNLNLKYENMDI